MLLSLGLLLSLIHIRQSNSIFPEVTFMNNLIFRYVDKVVNKKMDSGINLFIQLCI